jgi:ribosomal-protein-alanine N-acetyltransferase
MLQIRLLTKLDARAILGWRYDPPYDVYNLDAGEGEETIRALLNPAYAYHAIDDEQGELVAACCFGLDARVSGGDYGADALDVGMGVRPDLTGQGRGSAFVEAVLDFARREFAPSAFRVTIAAFNRRAQRVWEKAGFRQVQAFGRQGDGEPVVVLVRTYLPGEDRI